MKNPNESSQATKMKVGLFTIGSLLLVGALTIYVNNKPFWWRTCKVAQVTVEDATGLKMKSPVKSLGLDIGYVSDIGLVENGVKLKICITAPVEVQPDTKAYVRSEGFLGDKFLELKPVRYLGEKNMTYQLRLFPVFAILASFSTPAHAQDNNQEKNIPVGSKGADMSQVMNQLDGIMTEVRGVTSQLKDSIDPNEIKGAVRQLNRTLEAASKVLSPESGLTVTAQRSLLKLEDAIEQFRDQLTRINQGEGSVGKLLNDPVYAEETKKALQNLNRLLNRAAELRLTVSLGVQQLSAYSASRAVFEVHLMPRPDRFYILGMANDPRGNISQTVNTISVGGTSITTTNTKLERGGISITGMLGKVLSPRVSMALGMLYGDGAASVFVNLGPVGELESLQLRGDLYFRPDIGTSTWTTHADTRFSLSYQPYSVIFLNAGIEGLRRANGQFSAFYGAGLRFEDEDIKLIFSFL